MENYIELSIELHLFFARIMKEHSLFLEAGFMAKNEAFIKRAEWFRKQFEDLLRDTVSLSGGVVRVSVINSEEMVTPFTLHAEKKTIQLTAIPIDGRITVMQQRFMTGCKVCDTPKMQSCIRALNQKALRLVCGLIEFKEELLRKVSCCTVFTANYPLLIEHITREAKAYRSCIQRLESSKTVCMQNRKEEEGFWNQIMMEHALFIRGLLDPSEEELIRKADEFAKEYKCLLEESKKQCDRVSESYIMRERKETTEFHDFKTAAAKGILNCEISSIILPLLADHVLREANHYLRLLKESYF